jgi:hypothetical protein
MSRRVCITCQSFFLTERNDHVCEVCVEAAREYSVLDGRRAGTCVPANRGDAVEAPEVQRDVERAAQPSKKPESVRRAVREEMARIMGIAI